MAELEVLDPHKLWEVTILENLNCHHWLSSMGEGIHMSMWSPLRVVNRVVARRYSSCICQKMAGWIGILGPPPT